MLTFRRFTEEDWLKIYELDPRDIDRREAWAALGLEFREALVFSINQSKHVYVLLHDGKVCGVFGLAVHTIDGKTIGVPWFTSDDRPFLGENRWTFLRGSIDIINVFFEEVDSLTNIISIFNRDSIRWLRWLGFTVGPDAYSYKRDPNFYFYSFSLQKGEQRCAIPSP